MHVHKAFWSEALCFFLNCPSPCFGASGWLSLAKMDDHANYKALRPVSPQRTGLLAAHWSVRGSARLPNISARNGNTGWGRKEIWFHACMHRHTCACRLTNMHTNKQNCGGWGVWVACCLQRVSGNKKKHQMHWCLTEMQLEFQFNILLQIKSSCRLETRSKLYRAAWAWLVQGLAKFRRYPKLYIMLLSE